MEQTIKNKLLLLRGIVTQLLPLLLTLLLMLGAVIFLASLLRQTWNTLGAFQTVSALRQEVVSETLQRGRFEQVIARIKEKTKKREIDWKKYPSIF